MVFVSRRLSDAFADNAYDNHFELTAADLHKIPPARWWEYISFWAQEVDKVLCRMVNSMIAAGKDVQRLVTELSVAKNDLGFAKQFHEPSERIRVRTEAFETLQCSLAHFETIRDECIEDAKSKLAEADAVWYDFFMAMGGPDVVNDPDRPTNFDLFNPFERIHAVLDKYD